MNNGFDEAAPYHMVIEDAVNKIMAGENADAVLETMLSRVPARRRDAIKRRFAEFLSARRSGVETPVKAQAPVPAPAPANRVAQLVFNLTAAAQLIAQGTLSKIQGLLRSKPDVQSAVMREAQLLARNGVMPDMVKLDGDMFGNVASNVRGDQTKDRGEVGR